MLERQVRVATLRIVAASAEAQLAISAANLVYALKYNPNWQAQPRVPAGNPDGGRWTDGTGGAEQGTDDVERVRVAEYTLGTLQSTLRYSDRTICIFRFSFGLVAVEGSHTFGCQPWTLSSAVTHGQLLNDN